MTARRRIMRLPYTLGARPEHNATGECAVPVCQVEADGWRYFPPRGNAYGLEGWQPVCELHLVRRGVPITFRRLNRPDWPYPEPS